jgi:hypothetical protein
MVASCPTLPYGLPARSTAPTFGGFAGLNVGPSVGPLVESPPRVQQTRAKLGAVRCLLWQRTGCFKEVGGTVSATLSSESPGFADVRLERLERTPPSTPPADPMRLSSLGGVLCATLVFNSLVAEHCHTYNAANKSRTRSGPTQADFSSSIPASSAHCRAARSGKKSARIERR